MKFRLIVLTVAYFFCAFVLSLLLSCTYKGSICEVDFHGDYRTSNTTAQTDTLTKYVRFIVQGYEGSTCYTPQRLNLLSTCYATKKCVDWQNQFLESSFKISFNKSMVVSGDTILPGTDIFQVPSIRNGMEIIKSSFDCISIQYLIKFTDDLYTKVGFEKGQYNVTFSCSTNNGLHFSKERAMVFKI